jgi:cyclopropane fatty-acyl-phospholipid synthase-like methyltransferase
LENDSETAALDIKRGTESLWHRAGLGLRDAWLNAVRGTPERRYAERTFQRMADGKLRDTLGVVVRDEAATRAQSERWLAQLIELGLEPDHLCVEYGCGSLWCAEPLIRYLRPSRFVGLDVTDAFYALGRERLGDLLVEKKVQLAVIGRDSLAEVAVLRPDFVFSHRVLHHVPSRGLARYMRSLCSLLDERTVLVIEHRARPSRDISVVVPRYGSADIRACLPRAWSCQAHAFGFVITHRDAAG